MSQPFLKVTSDFTKEFNETISRFRNDEILVGIPEDNTKRKTDAADRESNPINNATLLAINNFGSEEMGIPARPVMEIGIKAALPEITEQFKKAVTSALSKGVSALGPIYERAGIIAANSIKKVINSQEGIKEPATATLKAREARGFKGTKALIVTGQMRNAITSIVRGKK